MNPCRLKNRSALRGSIVLSLRGEVSFTEKVKRVRQLGGIAAIVGNNDERHPHSLFAMSGAAARPSFGENEIPSLMISYEASQDLLKLLKKCDREVQVGKMSRPLNLLEDVHFSIGYKDDVSNTFAELLGFRIVAKINLGLQH